MNRSWALFGLTLALSVVLGFGAKAMYVPYFASRRHQNTIKNSLRPLKKTGIDANGVDYLPNLSRIPGHGIRPVPGYASGIFDEIEEDYDDDANFQSATMAPPLAHLGIQDDRYSSRFSKSFRPRSKISSMSAIGRVEHPLPANRLRMNPQCLVDPPKEARLATRLRRQTSGAFYSFNPAAQQCERLIIPKVDTVPVGDNIYEDLKTCQDDCCPTALCRLLN